MILCVLTVYPRRKNNGRSEAPPVICMRMLFVFECFGVPFLRALLGFLRNKKTAERGVSLPSAI